MKWPTLTVHKRIYAGCAVLVGLAIAAAMFGAYQAKEVETRANVLDLITANAMRVQESSRIAEALRRTESQYWADPKPDYAADHAALLAQFGKAMLDAAEAAGQTPAREKYVALDAQAKKHGELFRSLTDYSAKAGEARAEGFKVGQALTAATDKLLQTARSGDIGQADAAGQIDRAVLVMRVANLRLQLIQSADGLREFEEAIGRCGAALSNFERFAAPYFKPMIDAVRTALVAYEKAVKDTSAAVNAGTALFNDTLSPDMKALQTTVATVAAGLRTRFDTVSSAVRTDIAASPGCSTWRPRSCS